MITITVCSYCGCQVRRCSPACAMHGWVHIHTEKHLCNPGNAWFLLRRPDLYGVRRYFAHARKVEIAA